MLITFERVWAVGLFYIRRSTSSFRCATTATSGNSHLSAVFLSQSGMHPSATRQQGVTVQKRGTCLRGDGANPRVSKSKRGSCSHPAVDHSRAPAIHSRKTRQNALAGGEGPWDFGKRCKFWFGVDLTETTGALVGEKQCPPFSQCLLGGVCPSMSNALEKRRFITYRVST